VFSVLRIGGGALAAAAPAGFPPAFVGACFDEAAAFGVVFFVVFAGGAPLPEPLFFFGASSSSSVANPELELDSAGSEIELSDAADPEKESCVAFFRGGIDCHFWDRLPLARRKRKAGTVEQIYAVVSFGPYDKI
jgi:hypothetical protein